MLPITKVTVPMLRSMASDILGTDVKVPSKILKADLYRLVSEAMDALHIQASNMDADLNTKIDAVKAYRESLRNGPKSFNVLMDNRIAGYKTQRNGGTLTPRQARRIDAKNNRQYGRLMAKLAA